MPSKRKKNTRRMRRVQAQRRALEDQYGFSGKGSQGVCAKVPLPKTAEASPTVPAVVLVKVPTKVPPKELVVKEISATDATKAVLLKAAEAPVEPPAEEPVVMKEPESVSDPGTQVTASIDEHLPIPAELEIPVENTAHDSTETHVVAEPLETSEQEVEAVSEESMGISEEKEAAAETKSAVKHTAETSAADVGSAIEASVDTNQDVVEVVEASAVVLKAISVEAESVDIHKVIEEDSHATSQLEKPLLDDTEESKATPVEEPRPLVESSCDQAAEGFQVSESAVEAVITEEQISETTTGMPEVSSQMLVETDAALEPEIVKEEIIKSQEDLLTQVETESKKDLAADGSLTVDIINGCLGGAEVAIEG